MKSYLIMGVLLLWGTSLFGQRNTNHHFKGMSTQDWLADLDFIIDKVDEYFVADDPTTKADFLNKAAFLKKQIPNWSTNKVIVELVRLLSILGDAHSNLNILFDGVSIFDKVPIGFYAFEKEWFITTAHPDYREFLGGELRKIGAFDMEEVVHLIRDFLPADNEMEVWANGGLVLQMPAVLFELGIIEQPESLPLVIQTADGQLKDWEIYARPVRQLLEGPVWESVRPSGTRPVFHLSKGKADYFYHYFEGADLFYCFYGRTQDEEGRPKLKAFFREMFKALDAKNPSKLLIDLRNNPGGDYNKSEPLIKGLEKRVNTKKAIQVFAATSRHTYSAAVITAAYLKKRVNATLIGEPGRSNPNHTDDATFWRLPHSELQLGLTVEFRKHLPELGNLQYLPVDVPLDLTLNEFREGRDPVWEYLKER